MTVLRRRPGIASVAALAGITAALSIAHLVAPEWSRAVGLDVWNLSAAQAEWERIRHGAQLARRLGLEVHAGHGLNFDTAEAIAALLEIVELNIGHFLIGEAVSLSVKDLRVVIRDMDQTPLSRQYAEVLRN